MAETDTDFADVVQRARQYRGAGKPGEALVLLNTLPDGGPGDPRLQTAAAVEVQAAALACAEASVDANFRLALFFRAQTAFYRATYIDVHMHEAYRLHARFWQLLGRPDMAARILRTIVHSAPEPECERLLGGVSMPAPAVSPCFPPASESWRPKGRAPRLLVLPIPGYDPGMDILYDGLCSILGPEQITEYPYKPLLHGQDIEQADGYPSTFHHPGEARSLEWVCARLRQRYFDAVLYADLLKTLPREALDPILDAGKATPWVVIDGWDDASNNLPIMGHYLDKVAIHAYFKREMIAGIDYGPEAIPLPLSYPDGRLPDAPRPARTQALFWAGSPYYGLRRLYLKHLEATLGFCDEPRRSQSEYIAALESSYIGLSLFGFGFDTIRYYEIPAHGALLLAERPPIVLPNDFVEGRDAVFFDDLPGLFDQLAYLFDQPRRIPEIAAQGHRHLLEYHTASARARQLLHHLAERLPSSS